MRIGISIPMSMSSMSRLISFPGSALNLENLILALLAS